MARIYVPEIPNDIVTQITTPESAMEWIKRLEAAATRLEVELHEIKMALKYALYPRYNQLVKEDHEDEYNPHRKDNRGNVEEQRQI